MIMFMVSKAGEAGVDPHVWGEQPVAEARRGAGEGRERGGSRAR